jgi:Zn finger protein HypA/HybF involved in hydrogenase expression
MVVSYPISVQNICCSHCGQYNVDVISGRELEVTALEIEE